MRKHGLIALLALAALASGTVARAQECTARVLQPVSDDLGNHWKVGQTLPVDIERDGPAGGAFCASGGSCVPRQRDGAPALQLVNCRVDPTGAAGDHKLVGDPRLAGAGFTNRLRSRQAAERSLSALGFSNAVAGGLADDYVNRPASRNGHLVAQALAGSKQAVAALQAHNP